MHFKFTVNGQEVGSEGLAAAFRAQMRSSASASLSAKLDGLHCPVHGEVPQVVTDADLKSAKITGCCDAIVREARARLTDGDTSQGDAATASDAVEVRAEPDTPLAHPPKAFISHGNPDKERIARPLVDLLEARGIRCWLDERDLKPGRNMMDEIFAHGIGASDAVVVILSANSMDRPWVHEELSNAFVQRVNGVVKLLVPIVIDGVEPPPALAHISQVRMTDVAGELPRRAAQIADAILDTQPAPVAPPPPYAGIPVRGLSGLQANDERLFAFACEQVLALPNAHPYVDLHHLSARAEELGMSRDTVEESIGALAQRGWFNDLRHFLGQMGPRFARIAPFAFERYLNAYRAADYRREKLTILSAIVNENAGHSRAIVQQFGIHEYIVDHALEELERAGHIRAIHSMDGIHFTGTPTLRRVLREVEGDVR